MKKTSVFLYAILGFLAGFLLTLIGVTVEDYYHGLSLRLSLSNFHHFYGPAAVGGIFGLLTYFHYTMSRRQSAVMFKMLDSEAKHQALFENMTDVVCILDTEKNIIDVNAACESLYGYSKEEMLNMPIEKLLYKDDQDISNTFFEKLEKSGSYTMYEGRIKTKTGDIKWIQVNSTEIVQNCNRIGSQDIIRDITKRKKIEIELQQTVRELDALNKTKDKLFSIIAHDLRSPFSSILGISELMLEDIRQGRFDTMEKSMSNINTSAHHTLLLLENLLSWAKSQTGQISFNPIMCNAYKLVSEVVEILNESALVKNIKVSISMAHDVEISADPNMLMIILRNLVSNAIKFTREKGEVEISGTLEDNEFEICVSDNGVGIDADTVKKLLTQEVNSSTRGTSNEKGSGLGLVLCRELAEAHHGKLWIESEEDKGSQFKFTLPIN